MVCIRDAVLTVSPKKQYLGTLIPTTPATAGPEWIPGNEYTTNIEITERSVKSRVCGNLNGRLPMRICMSRPDGNFRERTRRMSSSETSAMFLAWFSVLSGAPLAAMYMRPTVSTWCDNGFKRMHIQRLINSSCYKIMIEVAIYTLYGIWNRPCKRWTCP